MKNKAPLLGLFLCLIALTACVYSCPNAVVYDTNFSAGFEPRTASKQPTAYPQTNSYGEQQDNATEGYDN